MWTIPTLSQYSILSWVNMNKIIQNIFDMRVRGRAGGGGGRKNNLLLVKRAKTGECIKFRIIKQALAAMIVVYMYCQGIEQKNLILDHKKDNIPQWSWREIEARLCLKIFSILMFRLYLWLSTFQCINREFSKCLKTSHLKTSTQFFEASLK